jgi:hypothetical protein
MNTRTPNQGGNVISMAAFQHKRTEHRRMLNRVAKTKPGCWWCAGYEEEFKPGQVCDCCGEVRVPVTTEP